MESNCGKIIQKLTRQWGRGIANRFVCLNDADVQHLIASEEWRRHQTADIRFYEDYPNSVRHKTCYGYFC